MSSQDTQGFGVSGALEQIYLSKASSQGLWISLVMEPVSQIPVYSNCLRRKEGEKRAGLGRLGAQRPLFLVHAVTYHCCFIPAAFSSLFPLNQHILEGRLQMCFCDSKPYEAKMSLSLVIIRSRALGCLLPLK